VRRGLMGLPTLRATGGCRAVDAYQIGSITKHSRRLPSMRLVEAGPYQFWTDSISATSAGLPTVAAGSLRQLSITLGHPSMTDIGPRWLSRGREDMFHGHARGHSPREIRCGSAGPRGRYDN